MGLGQIGQGGEECGSNYQADLIDKVTVTLVYTEDLAAVNRGCTCSRPSLAVLIPGSGIEAASGKLRGGSSDESISDVVEEQTQGATTAVREPGGKRQLWSFYQDC